MKWFKHDADANMDAKLQEVLLDYGLEGYGLFWYCLELITQKITTDNLTFELEHDARIIARNTGSSVQKVEEMMKKFVTLGLFQCFEGRISCIKLAERLDKSMTNSPQMRLFIDNLRSQPVYLTASAHVMTSSEIVSSEGEGEGEGEVKKTLSPSVDSPQKIVDQYNRIVTEQKPNWQKCTALTAKRKTMVKSALKLVEPRAKITGDTPAQYLGRLLEEMANDADFFSGWPNQRNGSGFNCSFDTNFRQERIAQAIDKFAGAQ